MTPSPGKGLTLYLRAINKLSLSLQAGLCSSSPSCNLIPYHKFQKLERPVENDPDRLSLALGPEVAALYCQNGGEIRLNHKNFTVLDVGGDSADITSYHIDERGHIRVTGKPSGNDLGGKRVNEQFIKFLQTIVNDPYFKQYLNVSDEQVQHQHRADFNKLIYESFEHQKKLFCNEDDDDKRVPALVNIPNSFLKFYKQEKLEKAISAKYPNDADLDGCCLTIEPQKMKEFFLPTIEQIRRYTIEWFKSDPVDRKCGAIYLLGEFVGCKFIRKVMQECYGAHLEVFVPVDPEWAVAFGAIRFQQNPEVIWARNAEYTFGCIANSPFDAAIHDPAYKLKNEEGKDYCRDLFQPFTEIGDTIRADEVLQTSITPIKSSTTNMAVTVYLSCKRNIWYARDKDGRLVSELQEVGTLLFDLQDIPGTSNDKSVILTMDLSQTEIHLKAHHEKTGKEVKVVLDCP